MGAFLTYKKYGCFSSFFWWVGDLGIWNYFDLIKSILLQSVPTKYASSQIKRVMHVYVMVLLEHISLCMHVKHQV